VLSSARRWTRMIVDGRGGAEVRCWESHKDYRPGEYVSRNQDQKKRKDTISQN
jgi:hypothetical protein